KLGTTVTVEEIKKTKRVVWAVSVIPFLSMISYVSYVKYRTSKQQHRSFKPNDQHYLRNMNGSIPKIMDNPGIRIESKFLSYEEQKKLLLDCKILMNAYGYS